MNDFDTVKTQLPIADVAQSYGGNKNLFQEKNKIEIAIERLQTFMPIEGYYLAFSGGKDSIVIKKLAQLAQVKFDAHYNFTTIDPPELTRFINKHHADVIVDKPIMPFLKMLITRGFPTRQGRWCCETLKESHGTGRKLITGIRWSESARRAKTRKMIETCYKDGTKTFLNPILEWSNEAVWSFIRQYNLPYCQL